jgi:DNA-binding NarL/FixJ family response regulator
VLMPMSAPAFLPGGAALSPREREVLALVAVGRSNKAIAEALFVSPNTVKTHVASLLNKLHADSRVQLAAIATKQGLQQFAALSA